MERVNHTQRKTPAKQGIKVTEQKSPVPLDESILGVFAETFGEMFNILRVGLRDIAVTAWGAHKEMWNKYKLGRLQKLGDEAAKFIEDNDLRTIDPEGVKAFQEAYQKMSSDRIKTINEDRRKLQSAKNEIRSSYMQVMRPIYRDLLQGQNGALLFMASPAVYMTALGARILTDPNALGKFANSDIAQQSDLNLAQIQGLKSSQDAIIKRLTDGFGAKAVVDGFRFENKSRTLNEQALSEQELQELLEEVGFGIPAELLAASPVLKELEKIGQELVQSKIEGLRKAQEDQKEEISYLRTVVSANSMEGLRKLSPEVEKGSQELEKNLQKQIDDQVEEFIKNPEAVSEFVEKKNLTDSSPENVEAAFRADIEEQFSQNLEKELEEIFKKQKEEARTALAVIERGILTSFVAGEELEPGMNFGAMPLPKDPDWKTLDATPAGRAWKKAITDYIESCLTLEM